MTPEQFEIDLASWLLSNKNEIKASLTSTYIQSFIQTTPELFHTHYEINLIERLQREAQMAFPFVTVELINLTCDKRFVIKILGKNYLKV